MLAALAAALYTDIRDGKIYNWLTLGLTGFALLYHLGVGGIDGVLFSLQGLLVGALIFALPFLLGGMGGGDIKLVGAIGAVQGMAFVIKAAIITGLVGGIVALAVLIKNKALLATLRRLWTEFLLIIFHLRLRDFEQDPQTVDLKCKQSFPYGIPIVCGTLLAYLL